MSALPEALVCSRHGLPVFPAHHPLRGGGCSCGRSRCPDAGKHPRWAGWQRGATTDPTTIRRWFAREPDANYLIVCGGVVVVDVDPDAGGAEALAALEATHGRLPDTVEVVTGRPGRHLYFRAPAVAIPSSVGALGPGIDVRGDGGLVIGPGSLHASGRRYHWELSSHPDEVPFAPMPGWLVGLAGAGRERPSERFDTAAALLGVAEGRRDATLFRLACKLRRADVPIDWAERLVLEAAANCDPAFPEETARDKVLAAYRRYAPAGEEAGDGRVVVVRVVVG